jgi:hypothetical protein
MVAKASAKIVHLESTMVKLVLVSAMTAQRVAISVTMEMIIQFMMI